MFFPSHRRPFSSLSEKEILALAISSEEDDEQIYLNYADGLRKQFPDTAKIFEKMAEEESLHLHRLIELFANRFGGHIPLLRREHMREFYERKPDWLIRPLSIDRTRAEVIRMEEQSARFYRMAAKQTTNAETRNLLNYLALEEKAHSKTAEELQQKYTPKVIQDKERESEKRQKLLTWIQPGLAGFMDGSISTLAPIFAAAFATEDTRQTFLIGLSASLGAGISMGFTEATHDDGKLSGRGSPIKRGLSSGIMTMLGGSCHTLPYIISDFEIATVLAFIFVFMELWFIVFIQNKFMDTSFLRATFQVILCGILVFTVSILIGNI